MLTVMAWCSTRSRIAAAMTRSPNTSPPAAERLVAGEHERPALVTPADELEEQVGAALVDRQVADLVDDQEPRHRVELELLLEPALGERLGERADHVRRGREQHAIAALDRLEAEPDGKMRLA